GTASCQVLQLVSPPGELRVGAERRGLQIVAVIAERSSHVVPTPVDDRGRAVEWWGQQREGPVLEGQWLDVLPDSADPGPTADDAERDVRTEVDRPSRIPHARPPQDRRGVGTAA